MNQGHENCSRKKVSMQSRAGYTPYEGFVTRGSVSQVWLRGQLAVENGQVLGGQRGRYIVRGKNML